MIAKELFQTLLLDWFQVNGRKHLPWQHPRSPYRVWVSEIMLQQTQVATVIPYFERFITQFPDIVSLSHATEDTVLHLWAGLGYYGRARRLHQTAQIITTHFQGSFPSDIKVLQTLPGIGRSTAGAIVSLGFNRPAAILDGNVKRLLSRLHAVEGLLTQSKVMHQLWHFAEHYTSNASPCSYTQAMMDFGTLVCTKKNPSCEQCPFMQYCIAYQTNKIHQYPQSKVTVSLPQRQKIFLILMNHQKKILLQKRPSTGIWGGLWSLLEEASDIDLAAWCNKNDFIIKSTTEYPSIAHMFSHFRLAIQPILIKVDIQKNSVQDQVNYSWCDQTECYQKALPAPIKKLLTVVFEKEN